MIRHNLKKFSLCLAIIVTGLIIPLSAKQKNISNTAIPTQELSLQTSEKLVSAAVSKAKEMGIRVSVAVMDQHGNLKTFERMDGAHLASVDLAMGKAYTAAAVKMPTSKFAEINAKAPGHVYGQISKFVMLKGGVPIFSKSGEPLGAIGISGATGDQDETCSLTAIQKVLS